MGSAPKEGWRTNERGQKLATIEYAASSGKPVAVLVWHHGLGEHLGRYQRHYFEGLAAANIAIHSFDCHGHGKSEPQEACNRAMINRYEDLVDDTLAFVEDVSKQYTTEVPFFMGGQSMGGLVSALVVHKKTRPWAGLIMTSPALDAEWNLILRIQAPLGGVLSWLLPYAQVVPALNPVDLSPDPAVVEDYKADPLNFSGMTRARTANEMLKAFGVIASYRSFFELPILAIHGTADKVTSFTATREFMEKVPSKDTTFVEVPGGYHELLLGPEKEEIIRTVADWIHRHSPSHKL